MNPIKIIFFDIDGTLVNMKATEPSAKTLQALRQLKEDGIILCIATGRGPISLPTFAGTLFDAYLTFNGAYCYSGDQVIYANPLPTADVVQIMANLAALRRPAVIATSDRMIANGKDDTLVEYAGFAQQDVVIADDFDQTMRTEPVFQLMTAAREAEYAQLVQNTTDTKVAAWWDRAVDIIPASAGKGAGIAQILAHYSLTRADAMAFGDGNNDIEMLTAVDHGIAMGNASPALKAVANEVIGHVADDGLHAYLRQIGLI